MCVALSRARFAMYVFGNAGLLHAPEAPHWQRTLDLLQAQGRVGPALPLTFAGLTPAFTRGYMSRSTLTPPPASVYTHGSCSFVTPVWCFL